MNDQTTWQCSRKDCNSEAHTPSDFDAPKGWLFLNQYRFCPGCRVKFDEFVGEDK